MPADAGPTAAGVPDGIETRRWRVGGRVQGVGFRPFVYRLAHRYGLHGWVQNLLGEVEICTQGGCRAQEGFGADLLASAPPLAEPELLAVDYLDHAPFWEFTIRPSDQLGEARIHVPPDYFTCDACLAELDDPGDRRYRYPFINCTQCGPRYTLISALPYDRANTSMAAFPLCPACAGEYADPLDRRFHAEPLACPECGPQLAFQRAGQPEALAEDALAACVAALVSGEVVAVKGVGGYHLLCDARDDRAIQALRARKPRPHKPLAVMFPCPPQTPLQLLEQAVVVDETEAALLLSPTRPIVLAERRPGGMLSALVAPGLREVGVMLPYSPLHHLLLGGFGGPLVATSGNVSGEPVLTENREAQQRLAPVAAAFLHHDRPIVRPADDSVYRRIRGRPRPLRLGRGCAPLELELPFVLPRPVIAVGGHMKNTLTLAWGSRAVVSPHIGDMGTPRSLAVFTRTVADLQSLYAVRAETAVCDAHADYATARWARQSGLPVVPVFHHRAHASALAGEHESAAQWLVFTWDGVGYGEDGSLWGGEALAGSPGHWERVASMRPFRLPGGDRAAREPWRSAAGLCWEIGRDWGGDRDGVRELLYPAWQRGLNAPFTSAVGRLLDGAAALTGVCATATYEGQGPMQLEALCVGEGEALPLPLARNAGGIWTCDWQPLVEYLLASGDGPARRAACVHASLVEALVQQALHIRRDRPVQRVGLAGGVFQNRVLSELACERLRAAGFEVCLGQRVPVNDAGLSFGQVIEYGSSIAETTRGQAREDKNAG